MPYVSKAWQGKLFLLARLLQEKLGRLYFHKVLLHARCKRPEADTTSRANTKPYTKPKVTHSVTSSLQRQSLNQTQQPVNIIRSLPSASQAPYDQSIPSPPSEVYRRRSPTPIMQRTAYRDQSRSSSGVII